MADALERNAIPLLVIDDFAIFAAVIPAVGGLVVLITGTAVAASLAVLPYCLGCAAWEFARRQCP